MIIAFVDPGASDGGRVVTRAKNDMSVLMRGQGRVPARPMPRGVPWRGVLREEVVATMRVRGFSFISAVGEGCEGGISVGWIGGGWIS